MPGSSLAVALDERDTEAVQREPHDRSVVPRQHVERKSGFRLRGLELAEHHDDRVRLPGNHERVGGREQRARVHDDDVEVAREFLHDPRHAGADPGSRVGLDGSRDHLREAVLVHPYLDDVLIAFEESGRAGSVPRAVPRPSVGAKQRHRPARRRVRRGKIRRERRTAVVRLRTGDHEHAHPTPAVLEQIDLG